MRGLVHVSSCRVNDDGRGLTVSLRAGVTVDVTIEDGDEYSWSMRDGEDEEWMPSDPSYVNHGDGEELERVLSLVD